MGTYIHAHIEVKKDGKWLHYAAPEVATDYLLFACLNGTGKDTLKHDQELYNSIRPVAKTKYLPDDLSEVTQICLAMDKQDFSRVYDSGVIYADEIIELQKQLIGLRNMNEHQDLEEDIFNTYIGCGSIARHRGFDDVRIVFWFDH